MSKKASLPLKIAPLQRVIAEPITYRAEQAALDKFRKQAKRKPRRRKPNTTGNDARAASRSATKSRG